MRGNEARLNIAATYFSLELYLSVIGVNPVQKRVYNKWQLMTHAHVCKRNQVRSIYLLKHFERLFFLTFIFLGYKMPVL